MQYFCELHDLENFDSFFCISHPTHSLECLHLGEETRWSAFSWARKGCKTQRGSSLKNKPARKFSLENIYQREGNERVCCTGHLFDESLNFAKFAVTKFSQTSLFEAGPPRTPRKFVSKKIRFILANYSPEGCFIGTLSGGGGVLS